MITRWFGTGSVPANLKTHLDSAALRHRQIAARVANATNGPGTFDEAMRAQGAQQAEVDIEKEMVALADNSLNFDAAHRLLQKTYLSARTAFRTR